MQDLRKLNNFPFECRSTKPEKNDELQHVERQVEKYRDVLQTLSKKISPSNSMSGQDPAAREKRTKKTHEYLLGQAMDESAKDLPDGLFRKILDYCGEWETNRAIMNNLVIIHALRRANEMKSKTTTWLSFLVSP